MQTNKESHYFDSFEQFIEFLDTEDLDADEICKIINQALHVLAFEEDGKETIIRQLKEYWARWGHLRERPFFLTEMKTFPSD